MPIYLEIDTRNQMKLNPKLIKHFGLLIDQILNHSNIKGKILTQMLDGGA